MYKTKRVSAAKPVDAIRTRLLRQADNELLAGFQTQLQGVCCPVHGTVPELRLCPEPNGYSVELVNDCCLKFTALCTQLLQP